MINESMEDSALVDPLNDERVFEKVERRDIICGLPPP
jgi:hypothetical protein